MSWIARFSVSQPVLVNLVGITMVIVGAVVMQDMTRESIPSVPTGWARVSVAFPGASATEVEAQVLTPIENAAWRIDGIQEMWGTAREGIGYTFIQFGPEIDASRATLEVQAEVASVELPEGTESPEVRHFNVNIPTIAVSVRGDVPEPMLRRVGLDLADALEKIDGVASVGRNGIRDRRLLVDVDPDRLAALGLPLSVVADALSVRAANVPAGTVGDRDARLVRAMAQVRTAEQVEQVLVRPDPRGGGVRVGDVATVHEGFAPAEITGQVNGEPGVLLMVRKEEQADSIRISEDVRALIADLELPAGVTVEAFGDAAHEVKRSLDSLYANAATGLVLVLALLWFFVGGRNAAMAALGLPVALAGAIAAMHLMGITINVISLLALILCLGIVVDDAIIIIENIYRHMENGVPRREAAIRGTSEVLWPVISSTATTCAAFLPMLLMTGVLGEFFGIIPKVVVASLVASLIEAFFILPSHMADFGQVRRTKRDPRGPAEAASAMRSDSVRGPRGIHSRGEVSEETSKKKERPQTRWERIGERTSKLYDRILRGAIAKRYWVIVGAYVLAAGLVAAAMSFKDVVLFTDGDVDMFDVRVQLRTDATQDETDAVLFEIERRLLALRSDDVEAIVAARGIVRTPMGVDRGDHVGMVTVYVKPPEERSSVRAGRELLAQSSALFDDLVGPSSLEVIEFRPGPPRGAPVAVRLFGDDMDELADLAATVAGEVRQIDGTRSVVSDYELGKRELHVEVDEERAGMHGLNPPMVARWLRYALGAAPISTTRDGEDEIDLVVQLDESARSDPTRLESLALVTPMGSTVQLREVATITHGRGPAMLKHKDRERVVKVTAQIDDERTTSAAVNELLAERLAPLREANPQVRFELGGEYERTNESLQSLKNAFVVALLVIFTILATQFRSFIQPLVVMAAIPLSFIGVVIGFFVSGAPIGLIALIGVVGLAGIVVNDSLVLVDFVNQRRREGMSVDEAIIAGSHLRLRPIFLTSITTVAGLFPLAIAGDHAPLLSPMATAIAWGLTFATVLTLVIVPCLYRVSDDISSKGARALRPLTQWLTDPGDATDELPAE